MVKTKKVWKIDFFKNDSEQGGAMNEAIKAKKEDQIVIHSQTQKTGRMWGCVTPHHLLKLLESNHGIYEVITHFPHKVYFDIDAKVEKLYDEQEFSNWIDNTLVHLEPFFPNAEYAISGSKTEHKNSLHIVLQNYTIHNEEERQYMKHLVKHINERIDPSYDWKVYTKNRNMKCINQSKDDGRVQQILRNEDFKAHCITTFVSDYALPFVELPALIKEEIQIAKSKGTFDLGQLPKLMLVTPDNFDVVGATPLDLLQLLPLNSSFNHDYTHLIARFCYYNELSFETFLSWLQKKHTDLRNDVIHKWQIHWGNLEKFPSVTKDRIIAILKYYYPHITKDLHYRKFSQSFQLPTENIQKIETISQSCFSNSTKKYFIFNVGMGGGKTAQTISYLKSKSNFLWIAPNRALATNTHKRFETEDIDVSHYEMISTKDKKAGKMKEHNKLICCLNSIHYIEDVQYDILIIDEIETLIDKFLGDFLEQGKAQLKKKIWTIFLNLFRNAKKVLLLDAFITNKTIQLIQEIETQLSNIVIYERIKEPQTRTIQYLDNKYTMIQDIINKLNDGCKLFIFYPYKTHSNNFDSMEELYGVLTTSTKKKGIFYNADVDDSIKTGLKDVNASWEDKDFIITNNIITCGVNYENLDFDYKYIFIASHNTPRDIIQVSYRARHLNTGIIKICYMGKMNQPNTWLNDCDKMQCPIYKKMYNEILVEKKAPLKRSFQLFCTKARYKQKTDAYKINEAVEAELQKMLAEQHISLRYYNIPNIDWSQAEYIEQSIFAQQATMLDKFSLNKYYFKKSFLDTADEDELAYIWNEKWIFFFKQLPQILTTPNHIFNEIATLNKFPSLFPIDVKKVKLNDEIKQRIFKEFSFKYINSGSYTCKIIKEIYNTYFCNHIITTHFRDKHATYNVDETSHILFEFAKENLLIDRLTYMTYNKLSDDNQEQERGFEV
jgi:hypothetical protein